MGSGGVSVVGAAEGDPAELDAVDSPTVQAQRGDGEAVAGYQRAADRPAVAEEKEPVQAAPVWADQTGDVVKAPHSGKNRQLECDQAGFAEIDLVSHSGNSGEGEFAYTLNLTDIHTGWTESRGLLGKGQEGVRQALEEIQNGLPFELLGLDSDNGSEFINWHLQGWCKQRKIQLTRGRPYKKDDNAHIEQKNWTHVRKLMGWERYDSRAAVEAMNDLYRHELRLWLNLYLPSVKLVKKVRVGSKVRRVYDAPQTPLERVMASASAHPDQIAALKKLRASLDPFQLGKVIERKIEGIYAMANRRHSPQAMQKKREQSGPKTKISPRPGCGKDARKASLEIAPRFPLSHSHGDGSKLHP